MVDDEIDEVLEPDVGVNQDGFDIDMILLNDAVDRVEIQERPANPDPAPLNKRKSTRQKVSRDSKCLEQCIGSIFIPQCSSVSCFI